MKILDRLSIRGLLVRCRVGVTAAERRLPQDVLITVTVHADLCRACKSDRLRDSVDYKRIKQQILSLVETTRFNLIERLAERVAGIALRDRRVQRADVVIQKPGALRFARCSEVAITRERKGGKGGGS